MQISPSQSEQLANSPLAESPLASELTRRISGDVIFDQHRRALYATDASLYQILPLAVVVPRSTGDVKATLELASEYGVSVTARGSGTSLSGQAIGPGIVIDFSKYLNRIVDLDPVRQTARVEPGVVLDQLNAAAAKHGLQFGPDVATSNRANIGGMIGNNSAGSRSILYGKTVDHVSELEVLSANGVAATLRPLTPTQLAAEQNRSDCWGRAYRTGTQIVASNRQEIIDRFPPIVRRVSGYNLDEFVAECRNRLSPPPSVGLVRQIESERYPGADFNLARLLVGAEGTLGVVTEALVYLVPKPARRGVVVLHFDSLEAAVASTGPALACKPSAAELFDGQIIRLAENSLEYRHYLDFVVGYPESLMLVEFSGDSDAAVRQQVADLADKMRGQPGLTHALEVLEPETVDHVWACRKAALPLLYGIPGLRKPIAFVEDTAVDPNRLPEFVAKFREIVTRAGTVGAFYGHASVGCLHIRPLLDIADRNDQALIERISKEVCDLVIEFHGAMSGEHGDGLARSYLNERLFGERIYAAFKQIKAAFDPLNILNPGKVVDGPSPIANLRRRPDVVLPQIRTTLDFSREGGFLRATEMCNGAGVCRKTQTGTMCPSFMATGDEEHSTRGRANALRLVLSGALPVERLTSRPMFETFDLCLQCKGCKAECPSNVDVAKMKTEFLHQYQAAQGATLGAQLMANVASLNHLGSALAPFSNWMAKMPGSGWLAEKLFGIDRRRPLPRFERLHFQKWFHRRQRQAAGLKMPDAKVSDSNTAGSRGPIVLLDDCLTSFCEPRVNRAAVKVLEGAGYDVHLAGLTCCGRAAISKGMLDQAKQLAQENINRLLPWAQQGVPIVGCEPSCLLTLTDEYLDLAPGDAAKQVASVTMLIETHLVAAGFEIPLKPHDKALLLHGHCHQKALVGMHDTLAMLRAIPGAAPSLVDSGCCGMAGSFGYEHYELSMKIGERVLLPAVRSAPDATILAPGFSCRHQIQHGAQRAALHPIELIAQSLAE